MSHLKLPFPSLSNVCHVGYIYDSNIFSKKKQIKKIDANEQFCMRSKINERLEIRSLVFKLGNKMNDFCHGQGLEASVA